MKALQEAQSSGPKLETFFEYPLERTMQVFKGCDVYAQLPPQFTSVQR